MSLVEWLPLTEQSGQANDYSGNDNHGTVNGATQGIAAMGGITGYSFDGVDDYVLISQPDIGTSPMLASISFWVNPTGTGWIVNPNSAGMDHFISANSDNSLSVRVMESADTNARTYTTPAGSVPNGSWSHYVAIIDEGNDIIQVYLNGEQVISATDTDPIADWTGRWNIGRRDNATNYFSGNISDFRVYDHALTPLTVRALHDNGMVGQPTDGTAKYGLEGDATDSFGSNDGAVSGATFTEGIRGQAASFNGVDNYIEATGVSYGSAVTVAFWARPEVNTSGHSPPVANANNNTLDGYAVSHYQNGNWYFYHDNQSIKLNNVSINKWEHFILCIDEGNYFKVYRNGVLQQEASVINGGLISNGITYIGRDAASDFYGGLIDDVRIYPYILSDRQIQSIYRGWSDPVHTKQNGVSYYPLNGDAVDQWGTNDGTVNGATETAGLRGRCYSFDGTDDYIGTGISYSSSQTTNLTVSVWVKNDSAAGDSGGRYISSDASDYWSFWRDSNTTDMRMRVEGSSGSYYDVGPVTLEDNVWYHFAMVFDITNGVYAGYRNGVRIGGGTHSETAWGSGAVTRYVNIGVGSESNVENTAQTSTYMAGEIDDARIYDSALQPHEINTLYRWGMGGRDLRPILVNQ